MPGRRPVVGAAVLVGGALAIRSLGRAHADDVPPDEIAQRKVAVMRALPLRLTLIAPEDIPEAFDTLPLTGAQRQQLEAAIASRSLHMVGLTVFDSDAEDGDVVRVEALGLTHTIRLTKKPVTVPVFLPADGRISITGIDEGLGGGVTLGVMSDGQPLIFAPLAVGQTVVIPATATASL